MFMNQADVTHGARQQALLRTDIRLPAATCSSPAMAVRTVQSTPLPFLLRSQGLTPRSRRQVTHHQSVTFRKRRGA
ncbi:hypothetical protein EYF80_063073 [Liparis tanakae]|uniref:Uncharacterized protein n=1 Tax=Liparis tanakae TaxID=230148 RepID=A0A4Z2ED71_9TELE|nr:hypothetical protein EYF80_063073 [Liparis tanakae]